MSERIDVVSTHLDDAAFSVGAWIHARSRSGARVRIVTVLAGDPRSQLPAGPWDARAGFRTEGEAALARRAEDAAACEILGADPVWLAFSDEQYERPVTEDLIAALAQAFRGASEILVPGHPLVHPDHRRIAPLALSCAPADASTTLYLEQPYACDMPGRPGDAPALPMASTHPWASEPQEPRDRKAKQEACGSYRSQLRLLGFRPVLGRIRRYESSAGGETFLRAFESAHH